MTASLQAKRRRRLAIAEDYKSDSLRSGFIERAAAADRAGIDTIFVTESVGHDAFIVLSEIARRTSRAKLCTRIASVWDRTPVALARAYKSLDVLSGGRTVIGIGAGDPSITLPAFGVPFKRPGLRLREYARILPGLVSGEPVTFAGEVVQVDLPAGLRFPSVQQHIPLWVAASGIMNLRTVAEYADGWLTYMIPFSRLAQSIADLRAMATELGRDPDALSVQSSGVIVANGPALGVAKKRVRQVVADWVVHGGFGLRDQLCSQGYTSVVSQILDAKAMGRGIAEAVPDEVQQDLIFVGDANECADRLDAEHDAGADLHQVDVQTDDLEEFKLEIGRLVS